MIKKLKWVLLIICWSVMGCKKDGGPDCTLLKNEYSRASGAFNLNPNPGTCASFKTAIINYRDSECATEAEKQKLEMDFNLTSDFCP